MSFIADDQAAEPGDPRQGALHHPTVAAQAFAALDASPRDARDDAASSAGTTAAGIIVGLVGVELGGAAATRLADRRDAVEHLLQHNAVVDVGGGEQHGQGNALAINHDMALAARLAAIGRVRPRRGAAGLGRLAASSAQRLQSIRPARPRRSSRAWCKACQTPAFCQSRNRRQQVMPEPQPISCGSISQGMPLLSTNRMPVSAARSSSGGRPPFGRGGRGGSRVWNKDQRASETRGAAIHPEVVSSRPSRNRNGFVRWS